MSAFTTGTNNTAEQLELLSAAHLGAGLQHLGTNAQITTSAGMTVAYGALPIGAARGSNEVAIAANTAALVAGTITLNAPHATLGRIDMVYLDLSAPAAPAVAQITGTAAASPVPPNITWTLSRIPLAQIIVRDVASGGGAIAAGDITDRRQLIRTPRRYSKAADETVNNSAALQNDNDFAFSVAANNIWICRMRLTLTTNTAAGWKYAFTVPAGATYYSFMRVGTVGTGGTVMYSASGSGTVTFATGTTISLAPVWIETLFTIGGTAGTVQFTWAQATANASNTTLTAQATQDSRMECQLAMP